MSLLKVFGWLLLLAGVAAIIYCLYSSYYIFSAKRLAPEIFKIGQEASVPEEAVGSLEEQMQEALGGMLQEQLGKMLPVDSISKLLNLISWSIFAGILTFAGSKLAGLGIGLIRKS